MKAGLKISIFLLMFISASVQLAWAASVNITGFRAAHTADKSRLVFDMTGKADYIFFTLSRPDRLVLDIKNAGLATKIDKRQIRNTPIKNMRFRIYRDYIRIVMDLKNPASINTFILPPDRLQGYRLVLDLTNANSFSAVQPASLVALPLPPMKKLASQNNSVSTASDNGDDSSTTNNTKPVLTAGNKSAQGRDIIVVIDPGHGGKDPGTTGRSGIHEKDVVLAISKDLQRAINQQPGFRAVLTRTSDYYISLRGRLDIARKDKADMFVAIHADAYPKPDAMGASVFALSERGATSEAARWLAEKENKSELLGGASLPDNDNVLRSVLIDLSQTNTISESLQIGSAVLQQMGSVTTLHHPRVEQAAFVVLKSPDIPSLLVETGFLSTPAQEQQLRNPRYQQLLASAIMQGVKSYFVRNPPQGTLLAAQRFGNQYATQ